MMYKELKKQIINWLLEHENEWQRVNSCRQAFKAYIYDSDGECLIGGEDVSDFIEKADALIYSPGRLTKVL